MGYAGTAQAGDAAFDARGVPSVHDCEKYPRGEIRPGDHWTSPDFYYPREDSGSFGTAAFLCPASPQTIIRPNPHPPPALLRL